MGELDAVTKEYLKDARVIADIGNFKLYGGELRILPEMLREMDTTVLTVPYGTDHAALPVQKFRDKLVAVVDEKMPQIVCLILGNEAEGKVHYAEPVKSMYYDAGQYADQVNRAAASRWQERRKSRKEQDAKKLKEEIIQQLMEEGWTPRDSGGASDGRFNMEKIIQMASETLALEEAAAASEDAAVTLPEEKAERKNVTAAPPEETAERKAATAAPPEEKTERKAAATALSVGMVDRKAVIAVQPEETPDKKERPTSGEFLGNFYKTDRLVPVITIVLHFSPEHWDAPRTLYEMFGDVDEALLRYIPDYHINLISPEELTEEDLDMFRTDLREVLLYIKYSKDKEKLKQLKDTRRFRSISQAALDVINKATNSNIPPVLDEKGDCDMCEGLAGMLEDARAEERKILSADYEGKLENAKAEMSADYEGKLENAKAEMNANRIKNMVDSIKNVMESFRVSAERAMQALNIPEADYPKYRALL